MSERSTRTRSGERIAEDRTDWRRVDALTEDDLARAIQDDPDSFAPDAEWIRNTALPRPAGAKERVTMRLDADLLAWFRRDGRGYQTRMNAVLRAFFEATERPDQR